jgi:hypothetical protein
VRIRENAYSPPRREERPEWHDELLSLTRFGHRFDGSFSYGLTKRAIFKFADRDLSANRR